MLAQAALQAAYFDDVDYTKLTSRLGAATPTGAGGSISIVEPPSASISPTGFTSYLVDVSLPEFNNTTDPTGAGVTLTDGSQVAHTGFGGHATNVVAPFYFGNVQSTAPGANNVINYDANHWMSSIMLANGSAPPNNQLFRVQNHSWVSVARGDTAGTTEKSVLRRADFVIEHDELTMVVGADNDFSPATLLAHPALLAHSYNAIVAERSDGAHSRGQTTSFYGVGRYRPDIVAPTTFTSTSSARVSSAATMLHEVVAGTDGARTEVMKAMLMAGATKGEFANWIDPTTGLVNPWNRTQTRPLDDVMGAGELNVYNSYLIGIGGKQSASASQPAAAVGSYGWDYQDRKADNAVGDLFYNFEVAAGSTASDFSILLAWNAKITDNNNDPNIFTPTESLQNLDLQLYDSTAGFMGSMLDQSVSTVDNVEHIYLNSLGAGTYTLKVSGAANWDYGLAWRMTTAFDEPNADFDGDGVVGGSDFLVWQRNFGTLINAANSEGDADGDGDVDGDDLNLFKAGAISTPVPPMVANLVAAVPEPSAMGMLGIGAAWLVGRGCRRRIHG